MKKTLFTLLTLALVVSFGIQPVLANGSDPAPATQTVVAGNDYPVVFVHGFSGWGRDELGGFLYWGGFNDLQQRIREDGKKAYTAAVGPVSSNWDRACELYAVIKGGTVDYGAGHSSHFGHRRFGRTYPGLYPQWDATHKIHLVSHSQGGQTVRALVQLLAQGHPTAAQVGYAPNNETSGLFTGGKNWVCSVTTISTPHDGTTLTEMVDDIIPTAQTIIGAISVIANGNSVYDLKLDQFQDNPSIINSTKDISRWDLSAAGAKELNVWVKAQPNVYYFSWSTEQTYQGWLTGHYYGTIEMDAIFLPMAAYMGAFTNSGLGVDSSWWQNDGVVNTNSMNGPKKNSTDTIVTYNGTPQKGKWNYMGLLNDCDHMDIVGSLRYPGESCPDGYENLTDFYLQMSDQLTALNP
jgi:triacylglycerol lipase